MVYVPGGTFMMGSDDSDEDADNNEKPQHEVSLDSVWIDRTEVTNAQYEICVAEGACNASSYVDWPTFNGDTHPVVGVFWESADNYCRWAGATLPTEAQWEYAARGTDDRIYPWGNTPPTCELAQINTCVGTDIRTVPVGSLSPGGDSWVKAADMAGNVWEWVADWYDEYSSLQQTNPTGPEGGYAKVLRGGSWADGQRSLRPTNRSYNGLGNGDYYTGFRCVVNPDR
jgi:serine/threonine-protein kinase